MSALWSTQNGQIRFTPHWGQWQVHQSRRRFTYMIAGTQGGKTSYGPWWLRREIYGGEGLQGKGRGDYLAVTATYDLFKLKMLPELRQVFEYTLGLGRWWAGDNLMELKDPATGRFWAKRATDPMWGRIILRSASSGGGLESATALACWGDEVGQDEFTLETWEAILRRLSLAQGRFLGTTTPYNLGWLKTEVYDRWADGDTDFEVVRFASSTNPAFPPAEMERAARSMQTWRFEMFYRGLFTRPAGLIYADFTDAMLVDSFPIPQTWPVVIGVDFGGANTAQIWLAEDSKTGIWYAFRESLEGDKTTGEHVRGVRERLQGRREVTVIGGAPGETQERRDWTAEGLRVHEPLVSSVEQGIDRVTELVKSDKLRVFRTLKGLRDELGTYRRKLDEAGNPTDEIQDKRHYHRLDALRYAATKIRPPYRGWSLGAAS